MPSVRDHWYWDTCVFVAYLNENHQGYGHYVDHIGQFLDDCARGDCVIYTSTLTIAEITEKRLISSCYGDFSEFLAEYSGSVIQVAADPTVMTLASKIKGLTYTKTGGEREVGTPDAIHLASALTLVSDYGVTLNGFHTFDNGKSKALEGGRSVPLLSYQEWCEQCITDPVAKRVIALGRCKPDHPNPKLPLSAPLAPSVPLQPSEVSENGVEVGGLTVGTIDSQHGSDKGTEKRGDKEATSERPLSPEPPPPTAGSQVTGDQALPR